MSRYMGWDREEMRAMGSRADSDDMGSEPQPKKRKTVPDSPQPSGFTPINRPSTLPQTDTPLATDDTTTAHETSKNGEVRAPRRDPLLKAYLGTGQRTATVQTSMFERAAIMHGEELPHKRPTKQSKSSNSVKNRSGNEFATKVGTGLERAVSDGMRQSKPKVAAPRKNHNALGTNSVEQDRMAPDANPNPTTDQFVMSERTRSKLDAFRHQPMSSRTDSDRMPIISPVTSLDMLATQQGEERPDSCSFQPTSSPSLHSASWDEAQLRKTTWGQSDVDHDDNHSQHHTSPVPAPQQLKPRVPLFRKVQSSMGPLNQNPGLQTIQEEPERNSQDDQSQQNSMTHGHETNMRPLSPMSSPAKISDAVHAEPAADEDDEFSDGLDEADFLSLPVTCASMNGKELDTAQLLTPLASNAGSSNTTPAPNRQQTHPAVQNTQDRTIHDDDCVVIEDRTFASCIEPSEVNDNAETNPQITRDDRPLRRTARVRSLKKGPALNVPETALTVTGVIDSKPFVRPPFPKPVRDRSAVIGLNPDPTIRVCFRVGEALNVGSKAVRENRMVFIELYARVRSSSRNGVRQSFVFQDLYHDHPPYLNAVYDIWKGVPLWEYDSGRFLQERDTPKMCRCIGKMKREDTGWKFVILNIWEAGPEDIDTVKGIIAA